MKKAAGAAIKLLNPSIIVVEIGCIVENNSYREFGYVIKTEKGENMKFR